MTYIPLPRNPVKATSSNGIKGRTLKRKIFIFLTSTGPVLR